MVSKAKLYSQLDRLEHEMRERIVPHLELAVAGKNDLVFCATNINLRPGLKRQADSETDALVQLGRQILLLREKLGEDSSGTLAERICWYCRAWSDSGVHTKTARQLAGEFLQEMGSSSS